MDTMVLTKRPGARSRADTALTAAARFWFVVVVIGQLLFAASTAAYYGGAAGRGDFDAWNRIMTHGWIQGEPIGNLVVVIHLTAAVIVILGGALQLLPQLRRRVPAFHRWNGRLYLAAAVGVSIAGLYMMWFRGTIGTFVQHLGQSLDAVLILFCAGMAWRAARGRDFRSHGRWAMRLYLVVSASLFLRASYLLILPLGAVAADPNGWIYTSLGYCQYLVPLGLLELYWYARDRAGARGRIAMASGLSAITLLLAVGIAGATAGIFWPNLERAYANQASVAEPLARTLATRGAEAAVAQYHALRAAHPQTYSFDEGDLNQLGYRLIAAGKLDQAIRILQLNAESFPHSSNAYDSLGEAYMDSGDKQRAIINYQRSLQLAPGNSNAARRLRVLMAR